MNKTGNQSTSLFHNDAHNHKITGILKQLKFRRSLRHVSVHVGTTIRESFLCLDKTTVMILYPRRSWRGQCHGSICCHDIDHHKNVCYRINSAFERKVLTKLFGPTHENGIWRIKPNQELDKIIKHKNIINFIRARRLGWLGHIERIQETRMVNAIHSWKPI
jgi:hypothetical protein